MPLLDALLHSRGSLALLAGAVYPLAFAPFNLYPLVILSVSVLFWLWYTRPESAAWHGWLFGVGLFAAGTHWLYISIHEFSGVPLWLAVLITSGFVLLMALFFALAGWLSRQRRLPDEAACLAWFPALWLIVEWLRGWLFTGFPWLAAGYSQIDTPLSGLASFLGVYGVSLALALLAGAVTLLALRVASKRLPLLVLLGIPGLAMLGQSGALLQTSVQGAPLKVSLIQGNVSQDQKWLREQLRPTLHLYRDLTRANWDSDLIIWPETAIPAYYHQLEEGFLAPLAEQATREHSQILAGVAVQQPEGYYNSLVLLGGGATQFYHKSHLVVFGEYMPFKALLEPFLRALQIPMSDFSRGAVDQPLLSVKGVKVAANICYEDAFGEEWIGKLPQAELLVNVSNDAWFGDSLAPHQHLQIARMRALEGGRYLLRDTNTGLTAIINPAGEVEQTLPAFSVGVLTGVVQPRSGATFYVDWGNGPVLLLAGLLLLLSFSTVLSSVGKPAPVPDHTAD